MDPRYLQDCPRNCWAVYEVESHDLASYQVGGLDSVYSHEKPARDRAREIQGEARSVKVVFGIDGQDYIVLGEPVVVRGP